MAQRSTKSIEPQQMHEDLAYAYHKLSTLHPKLDDYSLGSSFKEKCDSLGSTLTEELSLHEFYLKLSPVIASINQGHTRVFAPNAAVMIFSNSIFSTTQETDLSDFRWTMFDGRCFLTDSDTTNDIPRGSELLAINGIKATNIYQRYLPGISRDG